MEVDEALKKCQNGKWGRWHKLFYVLICTAAMFPGCWHMLGIVFVGGEPKHHCKLPAGALINESIPLEMKKGKLERSQCHMYANLSIDNSTINCKNGWEYDESIGPTIVTEWGLVCEKNYLVETSQTVFVLGVMVGAMVFSALSDRFGRKPVFIGSNIAMMAVGVITSFISNYYVFCVARFFNGAIQQGVVLTGFVIACEILPAENRTFAGTAIELFWAVAMMVFALLAYLIRNWRYLQLTLSLPAIATIAFYWFLPETIPWLTANGKLKEADKVIKDMAKFNNAQMPDHVFTSPESELESKHESEKKDNAAKMNGKKSFFDRLRPKKSTPKSDEDEQHSVKYTMMDVLRHRKLCLYALLMCGLWFVNSLVYYGLSLSTASLAGDRYLNFFLSGMVEFPAYASSIFVLEKWGRRWPLAIYHVIAGVGLIITIAIPNKTAGGTDLTFLITAFAMIGKFGITGSFATVFLYAPEIFPTTLRNSGMGISSLGGRIGNSLAPFSAYVAKVLPWFPGLVFGIISIAIGMLALFLPETRGRPLPQTIEDIDSWSRTNPRANCEQNNIDHEHNDIKLATVSG